MLASSERRLMNEHLEKLMQLHQMGFKVNREIQQTLKMLHDDLFEQGTEDKLTSEQLMRYTEGWLLNVQHDTPVVDPDLSLSIISDKARQLVTGSWVISDNGGLACVLSSDSVKTTIAHIPPDGDTDAMYEDLSTDIDMYEHIILTRSFETKLEQELRNIEDPYAFTLAKQVHQFLLDKMVN